MTSVRTFFTIATLATASWAPQVWAGADQQHESHHAASAAAVQIAQAKPASPGMGQGMGMQAGQGSAAYAEQMKTMQDMHGKMLAAKTPEERNALMAEHMQVMQNGMGMMGGMGHMGTSPMMGQPTDMATRQGMLEQRMDMMQSMMQMMMDRMGAVPAKR